MSKKLSWTILFVIVAVAVFILFGLRSSGFRGPSPLASLALADGRIINIEGIAFGTNLTMGSRSIIIDNFGRWLSPGWRRYFEPKYPQSRITLNRPGLIVWLDAIDPLTRSNVDCQRIRVELTDETGDHFASNPHWGGFPNFWRSGHVFAAFPRDARKLTLEITPWKTNVPVRLKFANPAFTEPVQWSGLPLPQTNRVGGMEIALTALQLSTNGNPKQNWSTPTLYWKPVYEVRHEGILAAGWGDPEWQAEDAVGNRGKYLGVRRPVLRFSATVYPLATNQEAAQLLGTLPEFSPAAVTNDMLWNHEIHFQSSSITAIGCFPVGTRVFFQGAYLTNPPPNARMSATRGGAPSGWVGSSQRISSFKTREWTGHYTTAGLVIYLQLPPDDSDNSLAIRLRDKQGRYWLAKPESQGASQNIMPYLIHLPQDVEIESLLPEIVLLKPLHAEFMVDTGQVVGGRAR